MKGQRRDIRNLIFILGSAAVLALIVVLTFIFQFGSSGTYRLSEVLVSPKTLDKIDQHRGGGFVFDKIEFVHTDIQGQGWGRYAVSLAAYRAFYNQVATTRSVPQVSEEVVGQFELLSPSTLTLFSQGTGRSEIVFQQVEFLEDNDLFRVQYQPLPGEATEWIYFSHPGIYKEVIALFVPQSL